MKYKNFLLRAVNLLLILGVLWQYQQVALIRAAAVSQRKQEIAEVEAYNASVLQAQSAAQACLLYTSWNEKKQSAVPIG